MHGETQTLTRATIAKRNTPVVAYCTSSRSRSRTISSNIQHRSRATTIIRRVGTTGPKKDERGDHRDPDGTKDQLSVARCIEEVAGAARELLQEGCRAVVAISRAVATLCRLLVRAATFAVAVTCLTVAVGAWAYTMGKRIWSKMFA
jgi:hypothetical protein